MSIDLLKMGLIRSGYTALQPTDDEELTNYLWPMMREMIKTAMENEQHLIIEGAYIPFDWAEDFCEQEREKIRYCCLIMIPNYIEHHFDDIKRFANVIEKRRDETQYSKASLCRDNAYNEQMCKRYHCPYIRIDTEYRVDFTLA